MNLTDKKLEAEDADGCPLLESLGVDEVKMNTKEPLLLGAVPIKSELIAEVQKNAGFPEIHTVITLQWRNLILWLSEAEKLTVLGYSFPKEDHYGRFLFQEAVRLRREKLPVERQKLLVDFYELDGEPRKNTESAIEEVFESTGPDVNYLGPVTPALLPGL